MCELRLKYEREIQTIVAVTFCDANEQYLKPVGILRDLTFLICLVTTPGELKKRKLNSLYIWIESLENNDKVTLWGLFFFFIYLDIYEANHCTGCACLCDKIQLVSDFSHLSQCSVTHSHNKYSARP